MHVCVRVCMVCAYVYAYEYVYEYVYACVDKVIAQHTHGRLSLVYGAQVHQRTLLV